MYAHTYIYMYVCTCMYISIYIYVYRYVISVGVTNSFSCIDMIVITDVFNDIMIIARRRRRPGHGAAPPGALMINVKIL